MDLDYILLLVGGGVLAGFLSLGIAKLAVWFGGKMESKRAGNFLKGKTKNEFLMDGEKININKFVFRSNDGSSTTVEIGKETKIVPPKPSKEI